MKKFVCLAFLFGLVTICPSAQLHAQDGRNLEDAKKALLADAAFASWGEVVRRDTGWTGEQKTLDGLTRLYGVFRSETAVAVVMPSGVSDVKLRDFTANRQVPMTRWSPSGLTLPEGTALWVCTVEVMPRRFTFTCQVDGSEQWACILSTVGTGHGDVPHARDSRFRPAENRGVRCTLGPGIGINNSPKAEAFETFSIAK